ncbi:MAG: ShlB/FhaC/HecB family hemolysin secretion/activation protein [Sandarakinorhabdus sp.]|nr:ShlB/FhaC/HecB family hemolysin secretion/activation protein [Sandarakinorhabdus sp.]
MAKGPRSQITTTDFPPFNKVVILHFGPLFAVALALAATPAFSQQVPNAGVQLQQLPPAPRPQQQLPEIRIERPGAPSAPVAAGPVITVNTLTITGATRFAPAVLVTASGFTPGATLSFADLQTLAVRITKYYTDRGYFVAQAYLPAQDVGGGNVTIAIVEGRYGKIALNNSSRLSDRVANRILSGLKPGDIVASAALERRLLLLSDLPGIGVSSVLSPGTDIGTADLAVDILPGRPVNGVIEADNAGNRYTGDWRGGGTLNINNPAGIGDLLSLRVLASTQGLIYGRAAYQAPVGVTTVGVAFAHIGYQLGREFKSLDASGTADVASVYASHPLLRSRRANVQLLANGDAKWFTDRVRTTGAESRRTTHVLGLGLAGDGRDGGAFTTWSAGAAFGDLALKTPADRAIDALTARAEGNYVVVRAAAARQQPLVGALSLYLAARGQVASRNLDSSEKLQLGGAYGVRAYPEGEAFGDEGFLATAEVRVLLPETAGLPGRVQLFGFIDTGSVRIARNPWFTGPNTLNRSGYGGGVAWNAPGNFLVKVSYARKLGTGPATSAPDQDGRFWLQIAKYF